MSTSSSKRTSAPHERTGARSATAAGASEGNGTFVELPGTGLYRLVGGMIPGVPAPDETADDPPQAPVAAATTSTIAGVKLRKRIT
jgi:hypothetical protein